MRVVVWGEKKVEQMIGPLKTCQSPAYIYIINSNTKHDSSISKQTRIHSYREKPLQSHQRQVSLHLDQPAWLLRRASEQAVHLLLTLGSGSHPWVQSAWGQIGEHRACGNVLACSQNRPNIKLQQHSHLWATTKKKLTCTQDNIQTKLSV